MRVRGYKEGPNEDQRRHQPSKSDAGCARRTRTRTGDAIRVVLSPLPLSTLLLLLWQGPCAQGAFLKNTATLQPHRDSVVSARIRESVSSLAGTALYSSKGPSSDDNGNPSQFANFNPFDYNKSASSTSRAPVAGSGSSGFSQVSLRKLQWQEILTELLAVSNSPDAMTVVLQRHEEFLLEPLEAEPGVENALLYDDDSIYTSDMTRAERYQAFGDSMKERREQATNAQVRDVLTMLSDFVQSHE